MNFAQTSGHVVIGNEFIQKLDETEKECKRSEMYKSCISHAILLVYKLGQESFTQIRQWRKKKQTRIRTIDLNRPSTQ
jgi:hypothetical protein